MSVLYTLPQDLYPASVATYRELTLFLSLYDDLWQYWAFVKDCGLNGPVYGDVLLTSSIVRLRELICTLPGPYELRPTANPLHYPTRYAEYSWACRDDLNRPVVLSKTEDVFKYMRDYRDRFRSSLTNIHGGYDFEEHDRQYASLLSVFDTWAAIARPLSLPPLRSLRAAQETGRLGSTLQHMRTLTQHSQ
jgi:hypothetical protein